MVREMYIMLPLHTHTSEFHNDPFTENLKLDTDPSCNGTAQMEKTV